MCLSLQLEDGPSCAVKDSRVRSSPVLPREFQRLSARSIELGDSSSLEFSFPLFDTQPFPCVYFQRVLPSHFLPPLHKSHLYNRFLCLGDKCVLHIYAFFTFRISQYSTLVYSTCLKHLCSPYTWTSCDFFFFILSFYYFIHLGV